MSTMASSIELESIWAPAPSTSRGNGVHLSFDKKSGRIAYAAGKCIIVRGIFGEKKNKVLQYTGHVNNTSVAKFAPSGNYIASGDVCGNLRVWSCESDEMNLKNEYSQVINGRINDISWDAESKRIIAVGNGYDKLGHCLTWDTGNSIGEISGHSSSINGVSIRLQRPYRAATVSDDGNFVFYKGPPFKYSLKHHGDGSFINDVEFSPIDGKYIACGGGNRSISLYNGETGEYIKKIGNHNGSIFAISWSPSDSNVLATASADGTVKVWDISKEEEIHSFTLGKGLDYQQVGIVFTSQDELISLSFNGDINILSIKTDKVEQVIRGHQGSITCLDYIEKAQNQTLISGGFDGKILKWDMTTGDALAVIENAHTNLISGIISFEKGIISCGWDDKLKLINIDKKIPSVTSSIDLKHQPIQLSKIDEDKFAILYQESYQIFNTKFELINQQELSEIATCITTKGDAIIIGYKSGNLKINNKQIVKISSGLSISCISIINQEDLIVIGTNSGKCLVYDFQGKLITSRWAFNTARLCKISTYKSFTATASLDTCIYIYSILNPSKNIKYLNSHNDGVNSILWINDNHLVSCGGDGCIKWWKLD